MTIIASRIRKLLDEAGVAYETLHHVEDFTAQETAHHTHTPGRALAKAVVVRVDGQYVMAVLPGHHEVDPERLGEALGHKPVTLASEEEITKLCPDCEVGAVPPFGNLYGLRVVVSPQVAENERITMVAGGHSDVIRMAYRDFEALVKPERADFSIPRVGGRS